MGNGPPPFSEIGKRAKDLLTKDFYFNNKFMLTTSTDAGVGLTATGVTIDDVFIGDIAMRYTSGRTAVDVKVDSVSNVSTTITVNEVAGVKASLSIKMPDQKSSKLDVQYCNDRATIDSSMGLTTTPLLEFSAAVGNKEFSVGAEVGFDSASVSLAKYNAGIGYNKHDFSAAVLLAEKGKALKASYIHVLNPTNGATVGAELVHRFDTYDNTFTFGSSHYLDPLTMMKTRFSISGKAAFLCQHQWRPKSFLTVSAEYDHKAVHAPPKFGLSLALRP